MEIALSFEVQLCLYLAALAGCIGMGMTAISMFHHRVNAYARCTVIVLTLSFWIAGAFVGAKIASGLSGVPILESSYPNNGSTIMPDGTIRVTFKTPVDFSTLSVHTFPDAGITTRTHGYFGRIPGIGRTLDILPSVTFPPGSRIMVYLANIESPFTKGYGGEQLIEFQTSGLPAVAETAPVSGSRDVPVTGPLTAKLTSTVSPSGAWSVSSTPLAEFSVQSSERTLTISPLQPLRQGQQYTLTLFQTPVILRTYTGEVVKKLEDRTTASLSFTTVRPALIQSFSPQESSVTPQQPLEVTFDTPMDTVSVERAFFLNPPAPTAFAWNAAGTAATVTHADFAFDTPYTVTFGKGTKTSSGGSLETDASFSFHTVGPVRLVRTSPENGSGDIPVNATVKLTFDQDLDASADGVHLSVTPDVPGKTEISGTVVEFFPDKPFASQTVYTLHIPRGLRSAHGQPSASDISVRFTTAPLTSILDVPYFHQNEAYTCNIASARMLLAYRGVDVPENILKSTVGTSGTRGTGNPHKGYVDGYGTYWDAVARGVGTYRPTRLITGGRLSDITDEIRQGNPVMIWGQNGWSDPHDLSWTAADGTFIKAVNGMHSTVIRGFTGPADDPQRIMLNDPWRGQYDITTGEFMRRWGYFNVAMVVD